MNAKIYVFVVCVEKSHISYYIICMTVPLANSLLSEYINPMGKNLHQKQFVWKKS